MMRRSLSAIFLAATACVTVAAQPAPADSLNAAVAVFVASNMKLAVDNALAQLVATGVECDTSAVRRMVLDELARPYDAAAHTAASALIERAMNARALEASDLMLSQAAARDGAKVLPDGLVFEVLRESADATGPTPGPESTVRIRYTGSLPDGSVFDSIGPAEEPLEARVGELAPGMAEGLQLMRRGGSYRLTMPASLGYGDEGVPGVIPPGCALQFEVELVDFDNN